MKSGSTGRILIGAAISASGSILIGLSFVIKKYGLLRSEMHSARAVDGGYGYLRSAVWWTGMMSMIFGEVLNFLAYFFAPAIVIAPLGSLSILTTIILGKLLLMERVNIFQKLGCAGIIIGTTMLIIITPDVNDDIPINELRSKIFSPYFIAYDVIIFISVILLMRMVSIPKYRESMIPYLLICSLLGTITISRCKSVSIILKNASLHRSISKDVWLLLYLLLELGLCIVVQIIYLNRVLDVHPTVKVSPVYFTFFTIFVVIFNLIMFPDRKYLSALFISGSIISIFIIILGVFLISRNTASDSTRENDRSV